MIDRRTFATLGLLLVLCNAITVEYREMGHSSATLFSEAEELANLKLDTIILVDQASEKIGVGFPKCRMRSVFLPKRDILAHYRDTELPLNRYVAEALKPNVDKLRQYCLKTLPPNAETLSRETVEYDRWQIARENPGYVAVAMLMTVGALVGGIAAIGGAFSFLRTDDMDRWQSPRTSRSFPRVVSMPESSSEESSSSSSDLSSDSSDSSSDESSSEE